MSMGVIFVRYLDSGMLNIGIPAAAAFMVNLLVVVGAAFVVA